MSMIRWEPFRDLIELRDAMDRMFEDSYMRSGQRYSQAGELRCNLPIDVYITDEKVVPWRVIR